MRKTKEEEIRSEKDSSFGVTTLESFDFEDAWNFNHLHMSVKDCRKKLHKVEVPIKKG
jgi:CRISPR/Cas system-associated endonuclease/helicase Cas3